MRRPSLAGPRAVAGLLALAAVSACSGWTEHALLERFFEASRLRDKTALSSFATVVFEPLENGMVERFEIVRVAPEERSGTGPSEVAAKEVTVDADVRLPDGQVAGRRLVVTMQRALAGESTAWKITGIAALPR